MHEDYQADIGLEIHVQLLTKSKVWCGCPNRSDAEPNRLTCPVCLGYPGVMPVLNEEAVRLTCMAGLLLNCDIQHRSKFDRKNYFYPDQAKNYQISQYDLPLCLGGSVEAAVDGEPRRFRIHRIHLEEDVAKSMHVGSSSLVDFNRAGTPLMEIVTEPDFHHPKEVDAFLQMLRQILLYGNISEANLEEGNMRCDVNISARPRGQKHLGVKAEIKNMNSFRGIQRALEYEISRQMRVLREGGKITQETRRWDDDRGMTESMRGKESAHDYRYFPEPDLVPVLLDDHQIEAWRQALPELPLARHRRFVEQYALPDYDAGVLVAEKDVADFFEKAAQGASSPKAVSNWVMTEILRVRSERSCLLSEIAIRPEGLRDLLELVHKKTINGSTAKDVFAMMLETGREARELVEEKGLVQVSDSGALDGWVEEAIAAHGQSVEDYRSGKKAALQFLMGQVMKASRGKANPQMVLQALKARLD